MPKLKKDPAFVFVDLETTGLNHFTDSILEVGMAITDLELNVIDQDSWVCNLMLAPEPHGPETWGEMAWAMHQKNGLYELCLRQGLSYTAVENAAIDFMRANKVDSTHARMEMCGSSVHFDRRFLMQQLPGLEAQFHYRNLDVSTIKVMVNKWCPDVRYPSSHELDKQHRALSDVNETIAELHYYREVLGLNEGRNDQARWQNKQDDALEKLRNEAFGWVPPIPPPPPKTVDPSSSGGFGLTLTNHGDEFIVKVSHDDGDPLTRTSKVTQFTCPPHTTHFEKIWP